MDFYREQVPINPESGLTVSRRNPVGAALQDAGSTMTKIAADYMRRMGREEAEASIATEDIRAKRSWLEAEVQMSAMSEPKEITSFYEEWEAGEREAIGDIDTNRLGKRAIGQRSERVLMDRRIKATGLGGFADQAQTSKNALSMWDVYNSSVDGITPNGSESPREGAFKALDTLYGWKQITSKQLSDGKANFDRDADRSSAVGLVAGLRAFEGNPDTLVAEAADVAAEIERLEHLGSAKSWHIAQAEAVGRAAKGASVKQRKKILDKATENAMEMRTTPDDIVAVSMALGGTREDAQQLSTSAIRGIEIVAMDDESLTDIQTEVSAYTNGDQTPAEAMKAIKKHAKTYGEGFTGAQKKKAIAVATYQGSLQLSAVMYDAADENQMSAMYDAGWYAKQKSAKQEGILADGTRMISDYLVLGGSDAKWVKKTNLQLWKLNQKKDKYTQKEITEKMNAIFENKGMEIFQKSYTFEKEEPPTPAGQYAEGKVYVDGKGNRARWNGTSFEEVK